MVRTGARIPVGRRLVAGERFADFRIEQLLGWGSFGTVYRAAERQLDGERTVALKIIDPADSVTGDRARRRDRFLREVRALGAGHHPHIVPVHRADELDGLLYLAMPLLPGDLGDEIERRGRFDPASAGKIAGQIATALHTAHSRGIIHRDVKPANVLMFTNVDGQPHAYLADFGLAALVDDDRLTADGALLGTIRYMAPEQLRGEPATAASDVFAAGLVLHEMLIGQPLCAAETCTGMAAADPLTAGLHAIALRACAAEPGQRHSDARALSQSLAAVLGTGLQSDDPALTVASRRPSATTTTTPGISGSGQWLDPAPSLSLPTATVTVTAASSSIPPADRVDGEPRQDGAPRRDIADGTTVRGRQAAGQSGPSAPRRYGRPALIGASTTVITLVTLVVLLMTRRDGTAHSLSSQPDGQTRRGLPASASAAPSSPSRPTSSATGGPGLTPPTRKGQRAEVTAPVAAMISASPAAGPPAVPTRRPAPEPSAQPPSQPAVSAAPAPTTAGSAQRLVACGEAPTVRASPVAGSQPVGPPLAKGDVFDSDGQRAGNGWVHGHAPAKGLTGWVLREYVKTSCS